MEPFGLFQILQSFLSQNEKNTPKTEEVPLHQDVQKTEEETIPPQPSPEKKEDSTNQAFLSFMQAHENRAKRIKKS